MAAVRLSYEGGTIRIDADADPDLPYAEYDPRTDTYRAPAYRYAELRDALDASELEVEDRTLSLPTLRGLRSSYELRDYQAEALDAWIENDRRGVLELPTGSGKTVIGVKAIEACSMPTLVVAPTIDLVEQWRRELRTEFDVPVGQLGGGVQSREAITVSTYDSAYLKADAIGDRFGLAVFDEAHHLGGEGYREIARLLAAPARLGLTATFERPDGAHEVVEEVVGPLVHRVDVDDLAGEHLADYEIRRIAVELTPDERAEYERHQSTFVDYLRRSDIEMRSRSDYRRLVKRSGTDPAAREALLAKQRAREVMMNSDAKIDTLERLFERHRDDRIIVFTAHNDLVYRIAERFLVPAVTHRTSAAERREVLERFRDGTYSRIASSNVLDEGIDVPDANVAVVLSGSGSEREFRQRLGRILRPKPDENRAILYEVVSEETAEERVAARRRE